MGFYYCLGYDQFSRIIVFYYCHFIMNVLITSHFGLAPFYSLGFLSSKLIP